MFKFFEINSIRSRMVTSFLLLTFLILILALVSFFTLDRTIEIARIHSSINQLEIFTLNLIRSDNDFLQLETTNEAYFKTHTSSMLVRRDSLNKRIHSKIEEVLSRSKDKSYNLNTTLHSIDSSLILYNRTFSKLENILFRKGFKDYGLEGAMRLHAHKLEETSMGIEVSEILFLRRHEKDFLLRHDTSYLTSFKTRAQRILTKLNYNADKNGEAINHLKEYERLFLEVADAQIHIGLTSDIGLRHELNKLSSIISEKYFYLSEYSYKQSSNAQDNARFFYVIVLCGAIVFSILSAYWISKRLTEPITRLSQLVNKSIHSKSSDKVDLSLRNAADEIIVLTSSFIKLMDQTRLQMEEIENKSSLLRKRNKELKRVNRELDHFLYSTAHDMRSPLSSLLGLIHIARHEDSHRQFVSYHDMMEKSIQRQEQFIDQIVSFSKNKITTLLPEKLDWKKLISEILEYHNFAEGAHRIDKQVVIHQAMDFYTDKSRVTIILNNLVSNAIRYADLQKENPFIRIEVAVSASEAILEFSDNGIGIAKDHLTKIFDMFYRAHSDSKGSGLGLFILLKTVKRMRGSVLVKSEEKVGTTFVIRLPILALYPAQQRKEREIEVLS